MITERKSIIRRWETQVGIGIAVACFSVMGVFIGLKVGEGKKTDAPAGVPQAKKAQFSQKAPSVETVLRAEEVSEAEVVVQAEERPLGMPDLDVSKEKVLDPQVEFRYEQDVSVRTEGIVAQAQTPGKTAEGMLGESSTVQHLMRGLPGKVLENPPTTESSSEGTGMVKSAVAGGAPEKSSAGTYPKVHAVKSSDTLTSIAKEHYGDGSKWMLIFDANGLSNKDVLFVGQKLTIPSPELKVKQQQQQPVVKKASLSRSSSPGMAHRVQGGDTLRSLAKMYYNDESKWKMIYDANKRSLSGRETVKPGEILIIP